MSLCSTPAKEILVRCYAHCLIRTFLQAGKHVCVEYPMTMNYKAAVELWDLAEKKG